MSVDDKTELVAYASDCDPIFSSEDEMKRSLTSLCYGDLYTIGNIWIHSLRAGLIGVKPCFFPKVYAKNEDIPVKPKPMKASELPIYDSPHARYKTYIYDKDNCQDMNQRLLHDVVLPHVKEVRESWQNGLRAAKQEMSNTYKEIKTDLYSAQDNIKKYWRDDKRLAARKNCVVAGILLGYYMGSKGGVSKKLFYAACGGFTTGMLCFPKETDAKVRNISYSTGQAAAKFFNYMTGRNLQIREPIPCPKPKPPDEKYVDKCVAK